MKIYGTAGFKGLSSSTDKKAARILRKQDLQYRAGCWALPELQE